MTQGGLTTGIYCRGCGYDLRETEQRCPECGRRFDRGDAKTFRTSPRSEQVRRWVRRFVLLLLIVTLPPALATGWLAWGWWEEQNQIQVLVKAGWDPPGLKPIYAWVPRLLPKRWRHLADRAYACRFAGGTVPPHMDRLARLSRLQSVVILASSSADEDLRHLGQLIQLEELHLSALRITDEGLRHLSSLRRMKVLILWNRSIAGTGLKHLRDMTQLRNLSLSNAPVSDEGIAVVDRMRELERLNLSSTRITDAGMKHLAGLTKLKSLWLENTKIGDEGLRHLADMPNLKDLNLGGTPITDAGLEHLKGLTNLEAINLKRTHITLAGVERLRAALPRLDTDYAPPLPPTPAPADPP